jgi:hypothetical protein
MAFFRYNAWRTQDSNAVDRGRASAREICRELTTESIRQMPDEELQQSIRRLQALQSSSMPTTDVWRFSSASLRLLHAEAAKRWLGTRDKSKLT